MLGESIQKASKYCAVFNCHGCSAGCVTFAFGQHEELQAISFHIRHTWMTRITEQSNMVLRSMSALLCVGSRDREPTFTHTSSSSMVQTFHLRALSTLLIRTRSLGSQSSKSLCISSRSPFWRETSGGKLSGQLRWHEIYAIRATNELSTDMSTRLAIWSPRTP
jgi:hypothetical protein